MPLANFSVKGRHSRTHRTRIANSLRQMTSGEGGGYMPSICSSVLLSPDILLPPQDRGRVSVPSRHPRPGRRRTRCLAGARSLLSPWHPTTTRRDPPLRRTRYHTPSIQEETERIKVGGGGREDNSRYCALHSSAFLHHNVIHLCGILPLKACRRETFRRKRLPLSKISKLRQI